MNSFTGRRALHLLVLCTFAFAQPLFDLLGKTPEFFVVRGSRTVDIVVFALVVVLLPPAILVAVEALVALVSRPAAVVVHLVFVGALAAIVALQVARDHAGSTLLVGAVSAAAGAAFAALYARTRGVPMFLTVLGPAPILFLALFLFRAPVLELEGTAKALSIPAPPRHPPVVLVVLDEFPVMSILGPDRKIDAARFPNFARLARESTWYRNTTTVHEHTTEAVPAILTGQLPKVGQLPLAQDHPDNLFTLLGTRYKLDVFESVTQLCPEKLCGRRGAGFGDRMRSLAQDLEVVYGHLVLPQRLEARLPSVTETWQGFGSKSHGDGQAERTPVVKNVNDVDAAVGRQMWQDQRFVWDRWLAGIRPQQRPTLYALHVLLPHYPWRFLPNGKQYGNSLGMEGLDDDVWVKDPWVVEQGWQRHLFQVGFTDRLIGRLLARLHGTGIWDNALVFVVADHGSSFIPGVNRRGIVPRNIQDIAPVPLFVKYPHQKRGRIDARYARTVDIVPTIADVLGLKLPYHADGTSLRRARSAPAVTVQSRKGKVVRDREADVLRRRYGTLARQLRLFGSGSWSRVYGIGPHRELLGKAVPAATGTLPATVSVDGEELLRDVDPRSQLSPGHITGSASTGSLELAVAVNGRIAAVTKTYDVDGEHHWAAFVPDGAFRRSGNDVAVYVVRGGRLERPRGGTAEPQWTLRGDELRAGSQVVHVQPGALDGVVEDWFNERESIRFGGWTADTEGGRLADAVLVFAGGKFVYAGTTTVGRKRIPFKGKGADDVVRIGFVFDLPRSLVGRGPLRFFGVRGNVASELAYVKDFPWRPR
jgi:Sulfatase